MAALVRVDNPMGAEIEPASPLADVEAALARGGVTPDQASEAMKAMGKLLDERDEKVRAEVAAMIAAGGSGDGDGGDAQTSQVHAIMARLSTHPANFHQCAVLLASTDGSKHTRASGTFKDSAAVYYAASLSMALTQCITACGVWKGTFYPSCSSNDHCMAGTWCYTMHGQRCGYCGDELPLPRQDVGTCVLEPNQYGGVQTVEDDRCMSYNFPRDPNFAGFNKTYVAELCTAPPDGLSPGQNNNGNPDQYAQVDVVSWCEACVHPIDLTVNPETNPSLIRMNLSAIAVPGACSCKDSLKLYD